MSYAITPYAVSLDRLKKVIGCGDKVLLGEILSQQAEFFADIDMIDEDCEFHCSDALTGLVLGEINDDIPAYLYGYAFRALCAHMGKELLGISGISGTYEWITEIDAAQEANGVRLQLADLVYSGSPIAIPIPDDFPSIGSWSEKKILPALDDFQTVDFSTIDRDVADTMKQMKTWLAITSKIPEASIIGFLS
jgi:hypothetical protein